MGRGRREIVLQESWTGNGELFQSEVWGPGAWAASSCVWRTSLAQAYRVSGPTALENLLFELLGLGM